MILVLVHWSRLPASSLGYRLWCPSWPGGTSYPLLTQDSAFLLTGQTSCFSVCDDEGVLVFHFTQHSVVVHIIGLGFKEFHRETESDITLWQCLSDPLYTMCQRGWSGNRLAARWQLYRFSICVVEMAQGFGENSRNQILNLLVYCKDCNGQFRTKD